MYLGIDLGTSGVKVVLLNTLQHVLASADAPLTVQRPQALWSEQHPTDWWAALNSAMLQLAAMQPRAMAQVRALGLSGQMHGAVALDKNQTVLRPAILWNDGRAFTECAELEKREPHSRKITGNLAMPGFTAPKLLWLAKHEPAAFAQIKTVLLPKDWLRLRLTGECVSDMSDASGTLWLDVAQRKWSAAMLAATGLQAEQMPRLVEGNQISGTLKTEWAHAWGLPHTVKVAGGAGDNAASAVGVGATGEGQGFVSLGTSGVIFLAGNQFQPAPAQAVHAFAHALPHRWHQMSVMLSAASALTWATRVVGAKSESALLAQAASLSVAQRATAPIFLPYLSGERTPHNNPAASGVLLGLRHEHGVAEMGYAVMEGVSFGLMQGWDAMRAAQLSSASGNLSPTHAAQTLTLVGGGAQSDTWAQLLASGLNCNLQRDAGAHAAAAIGAARLAMMADGEDEAQICKSTKTTGECFTPNAQQAEQLAPRYEKFKALYPALMPHF